MNTFIRFHEGLQQRLIDGELSYTTFKLVCEKIMALNRLGNNPSFNFKLDEQDTTTRVKIDISGNIESNPKENIELYKNIVKNF